MIFYPNRKAATKGGSMPSLEISRAKALPKFPGSRAAQEAAGKNAAESSGVGGEFCCLDATSVANLKRSVIHAG
jgi:hypothetical protein